MTIFSKTPSTILLNLSIYRNHIPEYNCIGSMFRQTWAGALGAKRRRVFQCIRNLLYAMRLGVQYIVNYIKYQVIVLIIFKFTPTT
jgi:hypothetical protein